MSDFQSLTVALLDHFQQSLPELPDALQQRAVEEFFPFRWESISPDQRRSTAFQSDFANDPACQQSRECIFELYSRIAEVNAAGAPTVLDIVARDRLVRERKQEIAAAEAVLVRDAIARWKLPPELAVVEAAPSMVSEAAARRPNDSAVGKWYSERIRSWQGVPPTGRQDAEAALAQFGEGITRKQIRDARALAPPAWRKHGPRSQSG